MKYVNNHTHRGKRCPSSISTNALCITTSFLDADNDDDDDDDDECANAYADVYYYL